MNMKCNIDWIASIGAPKGDPPSVMVITEERTLGCQPMPIAVSLRTHAE